MNALRLCIAAAIATASCAIIAMAQDEPTLVPDVVDQAKLIPLLPEPPEGWNADKAEGSTMENEGTKITNVHRDYKKGTADNAPIASISILDSAANPQYVEAYTAAWNTSREDAEGYAKPLTIGGNTSFETYEKEDKRATLVVVVAKRFFVQIVLQEQDPKELQEWVKRIDLKKLAEIK